MARIVTTLCSLFFLQIILFAQKIDKVEWSEPGDNSDVRILLMGDVNIQNRSDPASAWRHLKATLDGADIRFCNLEGPLAGSGTDPNFDAIPHKPTWTHSDPAMVEGLKKINMDVVGVANNVTFPHSALLKSLEVLDDGGILHTGGGKNIEEAAAPVIIEKKGTKIGFIQYATTVFPFNHAAKNNHPGIAAIRVNTSYRASKNLDKPGQPPEVITEVDEQSLKELTANIHELKKNVDVVIFSCHWGVSNVFDPDGYQRTIAHEVINAGADIVLGHGAHKLQKIEVYNEKPIFYCTGQSVFDWWKLRSSLNGLLVRVLVKNKKVYQVSAVAMQRDIHNDPVLYSASEGIGQKIFNKLDQNRDLNRARLAVKNEEIEILHAHRSEKVPTLSKMWELGGFSRPECVVYDPKRDVIYAGNMNGNSTLKKQDNDGYISMISPDGQMLKKKWVSGLSDPKGMAIFEDTLWLNDVDKVVKIDVGIGEIIDKYIVPRVVFLNDISVSSKGEVFTNDADGHQTFQLKDGKLHLFWMDVERGRPNGILVEDDRFLIATTNSHRLLSVDRHSRKSTLLAQNIGRGDGIEAAGNGGYFISDYTGRIFYLSPDGYLHLILDKREEYHTADFDYIPGKQVLVVPTHGENTVIAFKVDF